VGHDGGGAAAAHERWRRHLWVEVRVLGFGAADAHGLRLGFRGLGRRQSFNEFLWDIEVVWGGQWLELSDGRRGGEGFTSTTGGRRAGGVEIERRRPIGVKMWQSSTMEASGPVVRSQATTMCQWMVPLRLISIRSCPTGTRKYRQSLHPLFGSGLVARGKEGCDLIYYMKLHTTCDNHHCLYISC
jgi:hypothetical protein